jgi:hypothetical protein
LSDITSWLMPLSFVGLLALLAARMTLGARALRARGRAIRPTLPLVALFAESGASGHSEANFVTRIGGAGRILLVSVTEHDLVVECVFPFNVFMYENPYDIEHRVPIGQVQGVQLVDSNSARVRFVDGDRQAHTLRLRLKQPGHFVSSLVSLGVAANIPLEGARG